MPTALSVTALVKSLTTLKLTSASRSASLTSRIPSFTSASVSLPLSLNLAKAFESSGYTLVSSEVEYIPQNEIKLDKESAISVNKLIVALEDLDDVQNVYTSADLSAIDE